MRTDVPPAAAEPPADRMRRRFAEYRATTPVVTHEFAQTWVLELPFTVPLTMNARMHWAVKAKAKKPYREAACVLARAAKIPRCQRIEVVLWYTPQDDRARDPLNLVETLKLCEDGLVDAGVIADDSNVAGHVPVMPEITKKGPPRPGGNRLWLVVTRLA